MVVKNKNILVTQNIIENGLTESTATTIIQKLTNAVETEKRKFHKSQFSEYEYPKYFCDTYSRLCQLQKKDKLKNINPVLLRCSKHQWERISFEEMCSFFYCLLSECAEIFDPEQVQRLSDAQELLIYLAYLEKNKPELIYRFEKITPFRIVKQNVFAYVVDETQKNIGLKPFRAYLDELKNTLWGLH